MYDKDKGLRKIIATSFSRKEVVTPEGLYIGNRMIVASDWNRIREYVQKLVRGLYYFEYGAPLSVNDEVEVFDEHYEHADINNLLSITKNGQRAWPGVFEYRCSRVADDPAKSMWLFLFYGVNVFVAMTDKKTEEII
jgi:hypothetical protein